MPVDQPFTIYQDQLTGLSHGLSLWNPNQKQFYNRVSIGDVGYLDEGTFIRMFNVILPYDDPSNVSLGIPEPYVPLDCGPFTNKIEVPFDKVDHYSRFVTPGTNVDSYDMKSITYKFQSRGALLSLPNGGHHEDTIRTKAFEDYVRDHVDGWFNWAQDNKLDVKSIEDIILVTGCTLVASWAAAVCVDNTFEAEISLASRLIGNVGASFVWSNVRGHNVSYHNSSFTEYDDPSTMADQCVFIRGFRAKRVRFAIRVIRIESADENALSFLGNDSQIGGSSSSSTVYPEQLSALSYGLALWNPNPLKGIYDRVSIGDVGYMHKGTFIRMFNVTLPWDHSSNESLGYPEPYVPLDCGPFADRIEVPFDKVDHFSRFVTAVESKVNLQAMTSNDITYKFQNRGALLSLPNGGYSEDAIHMKLFEDYILEHVEKWFNWAQNNKLGVERIEDIILVTGCTLVTSWAAAACVDNTFKAKILLGSRLVSNVGASFIWSNVRGHVAYHNSRLDPQNPSTIADQCVFIRGFRAKRIAFGITVIGIDDSQFGLSIPSFKRSRFTVYPEQLSNMYHGLALWNPNPQKKIYNNRVSIGDVGYMQEGTFIRMFNVTLPWDHPSNALLGNPEPYDFLDLGPFPNIHEAHFDEVVLISRFVTAETNAGNLQAMTPDDVEGVTYRFRNRGALLSLPNGGYCQDVIRTKVFEDYILGHVEKWFNWAHNSGLGGVWREEDLILVSGCTLVTSWAAAACVDTDNPFGAKISLGSRLVSNVGADFIWSNVWGHVAYHNSRFDPQNPPTMANADQCVFIRGFRAKRIGSGTGTISVIGAVSGAADEVDEILPNRVWRLRKSNDQSRNAASFHGDSSSRLDTIVPIHPQRFPYQRDSLDESLSSLTHIWGSSSSLDTIVPIDHENSQRSPYQRDSLDEPFSSLSHTWGSSSSLDTINIVPNPRLHPYPSSTALQSNGSIYNASLMTSPSYEDSLIEILDDIAERAEKICDEDTFTEDTTSIANEKDPSVR